MTERERHELRKKLEEVLGPVHSANLMAGLPPSGWDDVATKQDLEVLRNEFRAELHQTVATQTRTIVVANVGTLLALASLAFAALRLT